MKRIILLAVLLTACQPGGQPSAGVPPTATVWPTSTAVPPIDLTSPQIVAIGTLSDALRLPLDQILLVKAEAVDWPDTCLGIVHANMGCAQAVVPGFRIVLEADQVRYEYHTDATGHQITGATLALVWRRTGGIGGLCDALQVYLSGEVFGSSCKDGTAYPIGKLAPEDMLQLAAWARLFGQVSLRQTDPAVSDAMTFQLTFSGSGAAAPADSDKAAFFKFAQAAYDKVNPCC